VVLYTKRGKAGTKELDRGGTAYFYYWGQSNALWGSATNAAVVLSVEDWIYKTPEPDGE
jgi:hypothetical protein